MKRWVCGWMLVWIMSTGYAQWNPFAEEGVFLIQEKGRVTLDAQAVPLSSILKTLAQTLSYDVMLLDALDLPVTLSVTEADPLLLWQNILAIHHLQAVKQDGLVVVKKNPLQHQQLHYLRAQSLMDYAASDAFAHADTHSNMFFWDESKSPWMQSLIQTLDKPSQQVSIEAVILHASDSFVKHLGVQYELGKFQYHTLPKELPLQVLISAAEKSHDTQVIAKPKLLTLNLNSARIKQGKQIAYEENSASGATSIAFNEAVMELLVTPTILTDNELLLEVSLKQDVLSDVMANGQPTIDTKAIQANVQLKNGETVMLGGIYEHSTYRQHARVPILSRLPVLGRLFKDESKQTNNHELLIFVTPHIVI